MDFTLFIRNDARRVGAFRQSLAFARGAQTRGHALRQIFLYGDAVFAVSSAMGNENLTELKALSTLAQEHGCSLLACSSALQRRELVLNAEIRPYLQVGTLGQLILASEDSRLIEFVDP